MAYPSLSLRGAIRPPVGAFPDPCSLNRTCEFPDPFVAPEHSLGDGLEERVRGVAGRLLTPADRGENRGCAEPRLDDGHGSGVADDLPNAFPAMLAVYEETFAAGGQHPDAKALELAVPDPKEFLATLKAAFALLDYRTFARFIEESPLERGRTFSALLGLAEYSDCRHGEAGTPRLRPRRARGA